MESINADNSTDFFRHGPLRRAGQCATLFIALCLVGSTTSVGEVSDLDQKHESTLRLLTRHETKPQAAEKKAGNDEITCLKRAAYNGNSAGADALSQIYAGGFGIPADPELAYAWSEVAAAEGSSGAKERRTELLRDLNASQLGSALLKADSILMAIKLPDWNTGPIRGPKKRSHPGEMVERFIDRKPTTCPAWRHPS